MEARSAVGCAGRGRIGLSWVGYFTLIALFFYGICEAYHYYGLLSAAITAIPLARQFYWFLIRWEDLGFYTWFTYAYGIALSSILGARVFFGRSPIPGARVWPKRLRPAKTSKPGPNLAGAPPGN